jgi:uncharacterized protein YggE
MQAAIADAVRKAAIIAEAAGVQLGDILKIDYSRMVIEFDTPLRQGLQSPNPP